MLVYAVNDHMSCVCEVEAMHDASFDQLSRAVGQVRHRRAAIRALGGGLLGATLLGAHDSAVRAHKNARRHERTGEHQASAEGKKKKSKFCLNGQTVSASKKKRKKLLSSGATPGACATPSTRTCASSAQCGAGSICANGACQSCTVTCNGNNVACGEALQQQLTKGGAVYICPGRYVGQFWVGAVDVFGAGSGSDPASNTILDAQNAGRTFTIDDSMTVSLTQLRIIGGDIGLSSGGGVYGVFCDLTITACEVTANKARFGGGLIVQGGNLKVRNSAFTGNTGSYGGGMYIGTGTIATLTDTRIEANKTGEADGQTFYGGGIYVDGADVTTTRCEITRNQADDGGGGAYVTEDTARLTLDSATRITDNKVINTATGAGGGGILKSNNGQVALNGATVENNTPDNIKP